jgi:hypothetical protein
MNSNIPARASKHEELFLEHQKKQGKRDVNNDDLQLSRDSKEYTF